MCRTTYIAFATVLLNACTFQANVSEDTKISCSSAAACPADWLCQTDIGACVVPTKSCLSIDAATNSAVMAPDGAACQTGRICVGGMCAAPTCGDGVRSGDEACDDGNREDDDACRNDCREAFCGDGIVFSAIEECDDGNDSNEDACLDDCRLNVCGDGAVHIGVESCDDGNEVEEDECLTSCRANICGDGYLNAQLEECDDGNDIDDDSCRNDCKAAFCGDGVVFVGVEECDDGNDSDSDSCLNTCVENRCGDGKLNPEREQCDDGNQINQDRCLSYCTYNVCGDGILNPQNETCDDGDLNDRNACRNDCRPNICGDGILFTGVEICDDGNTRGGDGCRGDCRRIEVCGDGILDEGEICDDGNGNELDLCRNCRSVTWHAEVLLGFGEGDARSDAVALSTTAMAADRDGNAYLANFMDNSIYRYDRRFERVTRFAGTGTFVSDSFLRDAKSNRVNMAGVVDLHIDGLGRILVTDLDEAQIRQIDPRSGRTTLIAGNGDQGFDGDAKPAEAASLHLPESAITDGEGNVFISDTLNHRIRRVDKETGYIETIAGTGVPGFAGDGGDPINAELTAPRDLEFDPFGNLYVLDRGNARVRRLVPDPRDRRRFQKIESVIGAGAPIDLLQKSVDDGIPNLWRINTIGLSVDGMKLYFSSRSLPAVYVADLLDEEVAIVAGSPSESGNEDDRLAIESRFGEIDEIESIGPNLLYITDIGNGLLRRMDRTDESAPWHVRKVAGTVPSFRSTDSLQFIPTLLQRSGATYSLFERDSCGTGNSSLDLFAALPRAHRVYWRQCRGAMRVVAGNGQSGFGGDGEIATRASLSQPMSVIVNEAERIFIADAGNHRIRYVETDGIIRTLAGTGTAGFSGDGGDAANAELNHPSEVLLDDIGRLLIIDSENDRIRRIDLDSGLIETVLGSGNRGDSPDGTDLLGMDLNQPMHGVYVPAHRLLAGATGGALIFSERAGHRIRVWLDAQVPGVPAAFLPPQVFTLVGTGDKGFLDHEDGRQAKLEFPRAVAFFDDGSCDEICLLVSDGLDRVRQLELSFQPTAQPVLSASVHTLLGGQVPVHDGDFSAARIFSPAAFSLLSENTAVLVERSSGRLKLIQLEDERVETVMGLSGGADASAGELPVSDFREMIEPAGIAIDKSALPVTAYVAERAANTILRIRLTSLSDHSTWTISAFAGQKGLAGHLDGDRLGALFDGPSALYIDSTSGILYVAESANQTIRRIDIGSGQVSTIAGTPGQIGSFGNGEAAKDALFNQPSGLVLSPGISGSGPSLYVADSGNHRIRRIDDVDGQNPIIRDVVGYGVGASSGSGGPAGLFPIDAPVGLALDAEGNLYGTSRATIRILIAGDDHVAAAEDEVASIYGAFDGEDFPEPITHCLQHLQLDESGGTLYGVDECLGLFLKFTATSQ